MLILIFCFVVFNPFLPFISVLLYSAVLHGGLCLLFIYELLYSYYYVSFISDCNKALLSFLGRHRL